MIINFTDYNCPFCVAWWQALVQLQASEDSRISRSSMFTCQFSGSGASCVLIPMCIICDESMEG
ncbi:hypothetical protein OH492_10630 [Vibrio chagasii]|nr:hypothetical protein [Vibrio chagasii]